MPLSIQVKNKEKLKLSKVPTGRPKGLSKEKGEAQLAKLLTELEGIQEEMYAAGTHSVLIVFQGMDTSGKDGSIRHVLASVNPQGCRVESFKVPTDEELAHDFLWRAHKVTPRKGLIGVFNRSYYEDVLVVRVHKLAPEEVWKDRYDRINAFEENLAAADTIILKFFLHISMDEQKERLLAREAEAAKAWKLSVGDWKEREYWEDYQAAYEDALSKCSTESAPWHIIPADSKWFRNIAIAECLVERLRPYRKQWLKRLEEMSKEGRKELDAFRSEATAKGK